MRTSIDRLAERCLADRDANRHSTAFDGLGVRLSMAEAYELQFKIAGLRQQRGETLAGYKIGCRSLAIQSQLHLDEPVFGHLFSGEVYPCGTTLDAGRFRKLAIEGEWALRLTSDIPDPEWLASRSVAEVGPAFPVIELHNYDLGESLDQRAQELIATDGMNAGVVLPEQESPSGNGISLLDETISVERNGSVLGKACLRDLPGGPLASLEWLAGRLPSFGRILRKGQLVLTGSPLPLYPAGPGDRFRVRCGRLASVQLTLAPADRH